MPRAAGEITMDGKLDDAAWQQAAVLDTSGGRNFYPQQGLFRRVSPYGIVRYVETLTAT